MPAKTKYLRQKTTGRIFGWREVLSKRADMEDYEWPVGAGGPVVPDAAAEFVLSTGQSERPLPKATTDLNVMSEDEIRAMAAEIGFKFDRRFKIASVIKAIEDRRKLTHKTFDLQAG